MMIVRDATLADADRILEIYDYYIHNTAITFEYDTPTLEEFQKRIATTITRYPYLVIEKDGIIEGYAYASTFIGRAAADWACEVSIYLDHTAQKCGLGKILYTELEQRLSRMGILNLYASIAYPEQEDEYLTTNSADFHAHMGFTQIATFHQCGYKFDRWYHLIWVEKMIGEHHSDHVPIIPYPKLKKV